MKFIDKTGQRFGKLVVVGVAAERKGKFFAFRVHCDCGAEKEMRTNMLTPPGRWRCCGAQACRPKREPAASRYCRCGCGILRPPRAGAYVPEHRPNPHWTSEEDAKLRRLYHTMPIAQVALALGRPIDATYTRVYALGIGKVDGMESLTAAAARVGTANRTLKKRLAVIGIKVGYVEESGGRFQGRVSTADVNRAMLLSLPRRCHTCRTCGTPGHYASSCPQRRPTMAAA